jgi:zinc protease
MKTFTEQWAKWTFLAFLALVLLLLVAFQKPSHAQDRGTTLGNAFALPSMTMENGLEVIVIEDHSVPLVTIEVAVRSGAYTEPPQFNGLNHLYEHMFFKGNAAIPSQEAYLKRQRELGIAWNGTTSDERVNYFFTLGSDKLEEGVVFMKDAIRTPTFLEVELIKERQVVVGELERNLSNPGFHLYRAVADKMWWKYRSRKDTIGDRQTIETATIEKMKSVQKKFYVPNNALLILAGDLTPEDGFVLAQKHYGDWERGSDPFEVDPVPPHPPIPRSEAIIVNQPVNAVTVQMSWHGPSVGNDPEATYAADVFSFILGQPGSRFHKALVDSGLTLGVGISYYTLNHTGPISLSFSVTEDKLSSAVDAVRAEVLNFNNSDYFTDEQIQTAKTLLAVNYIYGEEKTSSYAHNVSFWWAVAGLKYYTTYIDNLQNVTRAQMARYVASYIYDKSFIMGFLIDARVQEEIGLTAAQASGWAKTIRAKKR